MTCRRIGLLALSLAFAGLPARAEKPTTQRFALTRYYYGYQADTRKPLPPRQPTRGARGESLFAINPSIGIGPWFGYGHAMWHRENLTGMRHAGIDVALPVFRADAASLAGYSLNGLDSLTQALIELKRDRQDYPLIGMFYDTTSLGSAASPLNVGTEEGKAAFYNGIALFFRHIPEEFRALAQTPDGLACILAVDTSAPLVGLDPGLRTYVDNRFQQDFGRRLLWVGEADWKAKAPNLDAYTSFNEGRGLKLNADGPLSTASIGPGYNDTGLGNKTSFIRSRNAGLTMIDDWRDLFKQSADWIFIESWNDYAHGDAVAPTRAYGVRDTDETMAGLLQFRGESGLVTQALRVNAPEVVPPKSVVPIEVVVQNGSLEQWGRGNISFAASWYQNGTKVEDGPKVPILQPVPIMGLMNLPVAAVTAHGDGSPLPDGKYELHVEFFKASMDAGKPAFTPFQAPAAIIPITIGTPEKDEARLITTDLSPYVMAGADQTFHIILRNDGAHAWPKAKTRIMWQAIGLDTASSKPVASGQSEPLTADVAPGATTDSIALTLRLPKDTPAATPGGPEYTIQWSVIADQQTIPVTDAPDHTAIRTLNVMPLVEIAHFPLGNNAPPTWEAGTDQDIRTVVRNIGATTWSAMNVKVGYHWFYWDGTEALWDSPKASLTRDLKPGEEELVHIPVTAPANAGPYVLVLDVWDGKQWISTLPATAGYDTSIAYVNITGGNVRPVDLTGLFDIDGVSSEISPADGEFADGEAFPSEQFPPDVQPALQISTSTGLGPYPQSVAPILYPAGYFGPVDTVGTQSLRRIAFRYPGKKDGERNFLLGRGQSLPLGVGSYYHVYLLGAATRDTEGTIRLNYADGSNTDVPMKFSSWTTGPQHGEPVGLECTYRRTPKGEDPTGRAYLYVYDVPVDPGKTLNSITLPQNRYVRFCAITADQKPTYTMPTPVH